jgi:hypothetical protein
MTPPKSARRTVTARPPAPPEPPPLVSGRWLLAALAAALCAAAICGYGALCLLFYQGQWQLLFHPSRTLTRTPAAAGLAFDEIHFDVTETGIPQLDGWWIPAAPQSAYAADIVLYLHDARGSLSDTLPALTSLHNLGLNVFAMDYRGFGRSAGSHPTERLAKADSDAAWAWLTDTREIPASHIIVYGDGVGATFAAHLAADLAPAGVILEDPNPPARQIFAADARARILPLFLLQNEYLDPTADLASAHAPRLFLDRKGDPALTWRLYQASSSPKSLVDLRHSSDTTVQSSLRRFLDEVLR